MTKGSRRAASIALVAALLFAVSLTLFWPGFAMYDTVAQYGQALSGTYDDWHPPVMARLWAVLHPLGPGGVPMLALQMALYWLGLGGIAAGLAAGGRRRGAAAVLAIGALPPFLGWQAAVLKDAQATGALLAAAGVVGWWRLRGVRVPFPAAAAVVVLLAYATLVRANAVFAAVPLGVLLLPADTRLWVRTVAWIGATLAVLALSPAINHRLLGASSSGVEHTAPLYDMAGIAVRSVDADGTGLTPAERATVLARHCVTPFFWDPLGDPDHCDAVMDRLRALPIGTVDRLWIGAIARHPLAWAQHRLAHLNSTDRWLVPAHWLTANPPQASEPNDLGLGAPGRAAVAWQRLAAWLVETPLGWPVAWIVVAVTALAVAIPGRGAARDLGVALLGSALLLEASFAVVSIASDLRYHLWSMIATAVAAVLVAAEVRASRRTLAIGGAALALVIAGGTAARLLLPAAPATYKAMLG